MRSDVRLKCNFSETSLDPTNAGYDFYLIEPENSFVEINGRTQLVGSHVGTTYVQHTSWFKQFEIIKTARPRTCIQFSLKDYEIILFLDFTYD